MRLAVLALLVAVPLAAKQPAYASAPRPQASGPKPPASPLLPADTAVHTGRLQNGLRYWIRHNTYPEHRLELRLVVRAGSILEDNDQRGLAHFIEHMGFNGTTHFAKNDLVKYLESIGVKYGADLNAETSFDETTYILPVPSDKPELVARAFDILQDWAMGDKFDTAEVAGERGVVVGEWRSGLGAGSRILDQEIPVLFQGSRYATRMPIGDTGIIAHATAGPLKRFYRAWYRPDLMAVVAVGDYPVDSLERIIRARFASMRNPVPERPRIDAPVPLIPGTRAAIITDPEATTESVELLIRRPVTHYRTEADERRNEIINLFGTIAAQRMQELGRKPDAPFVNAGFGPSGFVRDLQVFQVGVSAKEGRSAAAFEAAMRELRRLDEHGVLPAELERARASLLRGRESAAAEQGKTESGVYVGSLVSAFLRGSVLVSSSDRYRLAQRILPTITVTEMNAAIRDASRGTDRIILVIGPDKAKAKLPTRDTLLAILARTDTATLAPWTETSVAAALVPNPPSPGRIVAETTLASLGVIDWRLSNGMRVLIKPTDFKADQVIVVGEAAGGTSLVPDDQVLNAELATTVVQQSGAGDFDAASLKRKVAGKIAFVTAQVDQTSEGVAAFTAPKDLETALQLLWLNATSPRLDTAAVTAFRNRTREQLVNRSAVPATALQDTMAATLTRNSPRARPLTAERLDVEFDAHRSLAIYKDWFRDFGDFTFIIVGNVNVDSLRPLVAQWLAALPATGAKRSWKDIDPLPPEGVINKIVHKGKEPVSEQVVFYTGPADISTRETDLAASAAAEILQQRLLDTLREAMGATYGVTVNSTTEHVPRSRYRTIITFSSAPGRADTLWQAAQHIITALRNDGPTPDELQKYVAQARRETEVAIKTNGWWLGELGNYFFPDGGSAGRPTSEILQWDQRLDALTPAAVRDAARRFLDPARVARFVLLPQ